ncbi:F-box/kelch-repeat protein At3g06240-like [Pistacia vera]|uniref:F-box/kelch-repeat protein At3g06240-like n=1 Tax=Pistacia vera TaxID=55513 RepID=UPI001263A084|nr:F-box/kelch-repeat protein At3g06240-like [Pistacia vera]
MRLDFSEEMVETIGSCNGLFSLYVPKRRVFYFYNPSTRECSMEVPNYMNEYLKLILLKERKDDYPIEGEGFGYAPSIDDYKMYEENLIGSGTPLNGALHWLPYSRDNGYSIVSFDLVEEKFIRFPPLPDYFQSVIPILDVVDGCLCMLVTKGKLNYELWKNENNVYEIWVMKEYGVVDSWTRIFISKEHPQKPTLNLCLNRGMAFFLKDGDGNPILCYQEIDGTWTEVKVVGLPAPNFCCVLVFTESLVSPNWYISKGSSDS